jgi:hypothetical protein
MKYSRRFPLVVAFTVAISLGVVLAPALLAGAASQTITLAPGDTLNVTCPSQLSGNFASGAVSLVCEAVASATATLTATVVRNGSRAWRSAAAVGHGFALAGDVHSSRQYTE